MRKVIVNTTPIIALADIGYLNLLKELYGEILIPEAVLSEIISEPAHTLVKHTSLITI
jgi:predicted nucleic acid-binding protein